jgi:hypothetical protein
MEAGGDGPLDIASGGRPLSMPPVISSGANAGLELEEYGGLLERDCVGVTNSPRLKGREGE